MKLFKAFLRSLFKSERKTEKLTKALLPITRAMSTERGRRTRGAEAFGNLSLQADRNMSRSHSPAGRARQRWNPDAPLGMWYKEQLLAKLVELNHPDITMLKKSRVPRLRKAFQVIPGNLQKYVSTNRSLLQCKTLPAHFSNNMMVYCLLNVI